MKNDTRKNLGICILLGIMLLLIVFSFFGAWYTSYSSIISGSDMDSFDSSTYLTESTIIVKDIKTGTTTTNTCSHNDLKHLSEYTLIPGYVPGIFDIYNNTFLLMIIIIISTVLSLICFLFLFMNIGSKTLLRKLGVTLFISLLVISFIIILNFAIQYSLIQNESIQSVESLIGNEDLKGRFGFWSDVSYTDSDSSTSFNLISGPGYSWYLMVIVAILSIIGLMIVIKKPKNNTDTENLDDVQKNEEEKIEDKNLDTKGDSFAKFCPQCGVKLDGMPLFCFKCGYKLR
jgi:ABC-type sugar transport system permease subunit